MTYKYTQSYVNVVKYKCMKKPIRVCMVSCHHNPLDERIYYRESLSLLQQGYEVIHLCYGGCSDDYFTDDGVRIIQLECLKKNSLKSLFAVLKQYLMHDLLAVACAQSADIYHLHDVELCMLAISLKQLPNHPIVIYDAHEPYWTNFKDYWRSRSFFQIFFKNIPSLIAESRILRKVDYLIATEENVASAFRKKNSRTSVIYNYPLTCFDIELNTEKIFDAIYVGSLLESKGILQIINALIICKKMGHELRFVFLGDFYDADFKLKILELIDKNDLKSNVCFPGFVPFTKVGDFYQKSKIGFCLFPNNRTNRLILPVKLFEYLAFGLPVIGSNFGQIKQIIDSNHVGICVNPEDSQAVADTILNLLDNSRYVTYAKQGNSVVKQKYQWHQQESLFLAIYSEIIKNK